MIGVFRMSDDLHLRSFGTEEGTWVTAGDLKYL